MPFSDPLADGPVVQQATQIALQQGMTVARALKAVAELRRRGVRIPLVLMGYYNPWLAYGLPRLAAEAATAGVDGFIVPDLPPEEAADFEAALPESLPRPLPTVAEVMSRVMRDSKRGRANESADECACVLLSAVGEPIQTETMLSRFPSAMVTDWLQGQGLPD